MYHFFSETQVLKKLYITKYFRNGASLPQILPKRGVWLFSPSFISNYPLYQIKEKKRVISGCGILFIINFPNRTYAVGQFFLCPYSLALIFT